MSSHLHIAVVGLGRMGKIYAQTISEMDGARLYAVAAANIDSESDFLNRFDIPHQSHDAGAVFALNDVDAVIIATPTNTHHRMVIDAAAAGMDVFCEKPLALTLEDTHSMVDAVDEAGVLLQVGFMRRFDPPYQAAKSAIDAGKIGTPITFKSVGRDPFCPDLSYANPAHSGGLIVDMAIHDMDLARWLMGAEVAHVAAEATTMVCESLEEVGDVDNAVINLRFENGAIGNVEVSRNAYYGYDVRTEVLGSKAAVRVDSDHVPQNTLLAARSDAGDAYLTRRFDTAYRAQIHGFAGCIREGREPGCTGHDALAAFEIALAATYAAQCGEPVSLDAVRSGWTPPANST